MAATASDAESSTPASGVLDGNSATIWHSKWSGTAAPLPHWVQIDMGVSHAVTGLRYEPRRDGNPNGTIGRYEVSTSSNGATFTKVASGTWADNVDTKKVIFDQVTARYVRLTGLSEAGGRGPWSSASEVRVLSPEVTDPGVAGSWGPTKTFPIVPVAVAHIPGNKLVLWSSDGALSYGTSGFTETAVWDLTTGNVSQVTVSNTGHNMFCPGVAMLPDGRIMVTGGSTADKTSIYNPGTNTWSAGPPMNTPRGYQGMTLLSTGQAFVLGGSWSGGIGPKPGEVWTEGSGWRTLSGVTTDPILTNDAQGLYRSDNHGWFFAVSGGRVFHAGPSKAMNWITTTGNGSVTSAGNRADAPDMMNGSAVYYDANKILALGGSPSYQDSDATKRAYTVDFSGSTPVTTRVSDMQDARAFSNGVALPDGQVLAIGGQARALPFSDAGAVMTPELWNPATGNWTQMAPMAVPRTYHGVALLLPDGRVMSGGGGLCGTCTTNHPDAEIFTPPYLLDADGAPRPRPAITQAPTSAPLGSTISVTTDKPVTSFALVRSAEATHSVDNSQRRLPVTIVSSVGNTYQLKIPSDPGVALPGNWMLFALDGSGTPSVAATMNLPLP